MILALVLALLQIPTQIPNSTRIGPEGITITAISSPTAVLQFGIGNTWCATTVTAPKLPFLVSYTTPPNTALCATDPAPNVVKSIVGGQQTQPYAVTYTINGTATSVTVTIPALPPPVGPTVVSTKSCTATITLQTMSDGTTNIIGPFSCK